MENLNLDYYYQKAIDLVIIYTPKLVLAIITLIVGWMIIIVIKEVIFTDERILDRDTPYINVSELGESSVNFKVRALVNNADFWNVFFEKTENVKKAFDKEGITIPFPQRDVHLFQEK